MEVGCKVFMTGGAIDIYSTKQLTYIPFRCSQGGLQQGFLLQYIVCDITASL